MRSLSVIFLIFTCSCSASKHSSPNSNTVKNQSLYSQKINAIDNKPMNFNNLKGHPILFINIATQCGYTEQLGGLEELYQKYKKKGLTVIGIPSNDFGGQTPEEPVKVKDFCKLNYGVTFPLTEKTQMRSPKVDSFAYWLTNSSENKAAVKWNFEKFLVSKNGKILNRYSSSVKPNDLTLINDIESSLN